MHRIQSVVSCETHSVITVTLWRVTMGMKKSTGEKWKISKLTVYCLQEAMFGDLPKEELAALAADMEKNGLRDPIEILPDGTIITGHHRVDAAKLLGWAEIDVIVRDDLAAARCPAVE